MPFFDTYEALFLDHIMGIQELEREGTLYVGLTTAAPDNTDLQAQDEPVGGAYARVQIINDQNFWYTNPLSGPFDPTTKHNLLPVTFPKATAPWGIVTHFFLANVADGAGIYIGHSPLDDPVDVLTGMQLEFQPGDLKIFCN